MTHTLPPCLCTPCNNYAALKKSHAELLEALKIALYDLSILNQKDPMYRPRCKTKSEKAISQAESLEAK